MNRHDNQLKNKGKRIFLENKIITNNLSDSSNLKIFN